MAHYITPAILNAVSPKSRVCHGSLLPASHLLLSPSPQHSAMVPLSGLLTLHGVLNFSDIGLLADYGPPIAAFARPAPPPPPLLICHRPP
ncbi:unnamed protein product, partial [Staurois parvus]